MFISKFIFVAAIASFATCGAANFQVSTAGQFSSSMTSGQLGAPGGSWAVNFYVPGNPQVSNADASGFDIPFTAFSYTLNGAKTGDVPQSIRFYNDGNLGLFTLFFGPQTGFDSNGIAIPEFSFEGMQAFTNTTSNPAIASGSYPVTYWFYSDAANFDEHTSPASLVSIINYVPEPSSAWLLLVAGGGFGLLASRRKSAART